MEPTSPSYRRRSRGREAAAPESVTVPSFSQLYFGRAAAENEVALDPERFRSTYYDRWRLPSLVAAHERFLLLGPKGAGKSAAAWYIALTWERQHGIESVFRNFIDFDQLNRTQTPLTALDSKLVSSEVTSTTDAAWRLFLGVRFLESLVRDQASSLSHDPHALELLAQLQSAGLASDDYPQVLRRVRERKGAVGIPRALLGEKTTRESDTLSPGQVGDALLDLVATAQTPNKHLLAIDGLDKAITQNDAYWQTLAALIRVADKFRLAFIARRSEHAYILLMCRSDVFRRVRFADAAKIASDGGVYVEWQAEAADPKDVLLWEYLSRKADISKEQLLAYLPNSVSVGEQGGVATLRFLLDFTRYTPRDMSILFSQLQDTYQPMVPLDSTQVRRAADRFASQHLLSEIIAESVGLLPAKVIDRLEGILSGLPSRVFRRSDLQTVIDEADCSDEIGVNALGEYLFLQGAIGNYRPGAAYYQFYHRRDAYKFDPRGPFVLHTGLVYAMNVPWSGV